jgi:5-methylcytosine-specific restriction endonuclease McrA
MSCHFKHLYQRRGAPTGPLHWNWKSSVALLTYKGYRGPHWVKLRKQIMERDDYRCLRCGAQPPEVTVTMFSQKRQATYTYRKRFLVVHHLDGFDRSDPAHYDSFNDPSRLVTLCVGCHTALHSRKGT